MFTLLIVLVLVIGPLYFIYKPPRLLIRYFQRRWPDVLWDVSTTEKIVALTIDDAPTQYTDEIAEILKANDASATFFVIGGQVPGRDANLEKLVREGHELGNHAMRDEPSRSLSDGTLVEQIHTVEGIIAHAYDKAQVPRPPKYFRPGSGLYSTRMRQLTSRLGYQLVLGGIFPHDPMIPYWTVNARHILSMLRPGGIIICHDRRSWTPPMLRAVLPLLRQQGYRVVTVTELLRVANSAAAT